MHTLATNLFSSINSPIPIVHLTTSQNYSAYQDTSHSPFLTLALKKRLLLHAHSQLLNDIGLHVRLSTFPLHFTIQVFIKIRLCVSDVCNNEVTLQPN